MEMACLATEELIKMAIKILKKNPIQYLANEYKNRQQKIT